jgi:hypothetical protein
MAHYCSRSTVPAIFEPDKPCIYTGMKQVRRSYGRIAVECFVSFQLYGRSKLLLGF